MIKLHTLYKPKVTSDVLTYLWKHANITRSIHCGVEMLHEPAGKTLNDS